MRPRLALQSPSHAGRRRRFGVSAAALVVGLAAAPPAARAQTVTLGAGDFQLAIARVDGAGNVATLDPSALGSYFTAARCACPTNVAIIVALTSDAAAKLTATDALDVTLMAGSGCDGTSATSCATLATGLKLDMSTTTTAQTVSTTTVFASALGSTGCASLGSRSAQIWAIIRDNGALLTSQPSLAVAFGGAQPDPPSNVGALTADKGLAVSWTASGGSTTLQGHQVLCMPGLATPPAAAYEICAAAPPSTGTGP